MPLRLCAHARSRSIGSSRSSLVAEIMPPHLHPRSRMTSSLFATTVVASFFVVALPHILPCPAPRVAYADGEAMVDETGRRRRRRPAQPVEIKNGIAQFERTTEEASASMMEDRSNRQCPVPKPGGILGEMLGFHQPRSTTPRKDKSLPSSDT